MFIYKEIFINLKATTKRFTEFYLNEINKLEFETELDYAKIKNKITKSLQLLGHRKSLTDDFFIFVTPKASNKSLTNGKRSKLVAVWPAERGNDKQETQGNQSDIPCQKIQEENLLNSSVNDADLVEEKQNEGI